MKPKLLSLVCFLFALLTSCLYDFDPAATDLEYKDFNSEVGPEGKIIKFYQEDDSFNDTPWLIIEVPPGAVEKKIVVSIARLSESNKLFWGNDSSYYVSCCERDLTWSFQPQDIVFKKPVKISWPYGKNFLDAIGRNFGFFDTSENKWVIYPVDSIVFTTNQFGDFAALETFDYPMGKYLTMGSEPNFVESYDLIEGENSSYTANAVTWNLGSKDITNGIQKSALRGKHQFQFLSLPDDSYPVDYLDVYDKTYQVYNAYQNSSENTNPDYVDVETILECDPANLANCDPAKKYVGISGWVRYYKYVSFGEVDWEFVSFQVLLKNTTTGEEVTLKGSIDYVSLL